MAKPTWVVYFKAYNNGLGSSDQTVVIEGDLALKLRAQNVAKAAEKSVAHLSKMTSNYVLVRAERIDD